LKVFTLKANENWHSDILYEEWKKYTNNIHTDDLNEADILWLLPAWQWRRIPPYFLINKKVVVTVHHMVPEKFNKAEFMERDIYVQKYHVPCKKTYDFISRYTNKPIEIIGYWLNKELWNPIDSKLARKDLGIPEDSYVVGSFQRDTEGHDLKTPKLEKGPDLFIECIKNIKKDKDNLCVLLGAWRRQYVIKRLEEENIDYIYKKLAPHDKLKKMYASCDLYVVSSRYEGGPQAILEAAGMKIPIISTDVGVASDILSENCVFNVAQKIYYPTKEDVEKSYENVLSYDIEKHVEKYVDFFKGVYEQS
jgi:glycosyltransferase involved in cell wall biosynthesis